MLGLLGKNGSGKSTLMRLMAQKEIFDAGDIQYMGNSLRKSDLHLNPNMVYVSEDQILPTLTPISGWVKIFQSLNQKYEIDIWNNLVIELDLDPSKNFLALSRGQKMKTWFALQAPKIPQVYILDEITSVLDSGSRIAIMRFLESERKRGAAIIMSTNIASELQGFASHVGLLFEKELALFCKVEDLKHRFVKFKGEGAANWPGAKPVQLNSDGSWSYLAKADATTHAGISDPLIDRRGVTIEDVASFFSMKANT